MNTLADRVAIITGAGRGIGREHALLFAREGAKVVVNDLGGTAEGTGTDQAPAQQVVDEIVAAGGQAVANYDDIADWDGAQRLIQQAIDAFGDLHVLVNNAGILRDRMLVNMSVEEWDAVVRVHLRGHFCPTRWAAAYWRDQSKAGAEVPRAIVNTSSTSGLFGNQGQTNYGAAKTAIATFSIIADAELGRYGVRVNAIAPAAATRLTATVPRDTPTGDTTRGSLDAEAPGEHFALRWLPVDRVVPDPWPGLLRIGWRCLSLPALRDRGQGFQRRILDRRGAGVGRGEVCGRRVRPGPPHGGHAAPPLNPLPRHWQQ